VLTNVTIEAETWQYVARGKVEAQHEQIPLRLAYAQTIHKAQGQTLTAAYIDMNAVFAEGHGYTALSRVASVEGLYLSGFNSFMVKTNPRTVEMYRMIEKFKDTHVSSALNMGVLKIPYLREELKKLLNTDVDIVRKRPTMNPFLKKRIEQDAVYV
jgi:ATP-dependent exoDNAse (exonuclease V) alpha subunit